MAYNWPGYPTFRTYEHDTIFGSLEPTSCEEVRDVDE